MTTMLSDEYKIQTRFRRSARIDSDLADGDALSGYVLNDSAWDVLRQIFIQSGTSQQRAFTLTGPYGAGKSSLALLLSAFLGPNEHQRERAEKLIGMQRRATLFEHVEAPNKGWLVVPVVGARASAEELIRDALIEAIPRKWPTRKPAGLLAELEKEGPKALIDALIVAGEAASRTGDGLVLLIDEMGKVLEGVVEKGGDIQFFQELAEAFQRVDARCMVIGVLHQSFQEYASRAGRATKNEWAKVQGRYVDIPFSISQEDVITLVGKAIKGPKHPQAKKLSAQLIGNLDHPRYRGIKGFDQRLAECWPLHPMSALLLGPLSRSRFGQNERSTFGFLSSTEPEGFRAFLLGTEANSKAAYLPHQLWDYLQINLEPAILASSEAHRWSEAADAIDRASKLEDPSALPVAKLIAVLDLFGRAYGLAPSNEVVFNCFPQTPKAHVTAALKQLQKASIAVYRKHLNAWALFAGSDVDLDAAIDLAYSRLGEDLASLRPYLPAVRPVVAKRHYHRTGTLRWFDVRVFNEQEVSERAAELTADRGQSGSFVLVVPEGTSDTRSIDTVCRKAAKAAEQDGTALAFGAPSRGAELLDNLREVAALERVSATTPELEGDAVARRELNGRLNAAKVKLRDVIENTLENAKWETPKLLSPPSKSVSLTRLASDICDAVYSRAPVVHNELTNRDKPSTNAVAARRSLLYLMLANPEQEALGIKGHPAELGLYRSVLQSSGLHRRAKRNEGLWEFGAPDPKTERGVSFQDLWEDFSEFLALSEAERQTFADLYARWRRPPMGLRNGIMPILSLALVLSRQEDIALYVDGIFTPSLDDFFVDRLLQAPERVALQRFKVEGIRKDVLRRIGSIVAASVSGEAQSTPLSVAKPLAKFAYRLPTWVKRTKTIDAETQAIRDVLINANDPNVLLFMDIPRACGLDEDINAKTSNDVIELVTSKLQYAMQDLASAYDRMLESLADALANALNLETLSPAALERLSERSARIEGLSGDFRLDAFARRLGNNGQARNIWLEGLGGLAANKPVRDWADADLERAKVEITQLALRFQRIEQILLAQKKAPDILHVNGVVGTGTSTSELSLALRLDDHENELASSLIGELERALKGATVGSEVKLAALVKLLHKMTDDMPKKWSETDHAVEDEASE